MAGPTPALELPSEIGVHTVGIKAVQPQFVQESTFDGSMNALNPGKGYWNGTAELIDYSEFDEEPGSTGISQIQRFLMKLRGSTQPFELPLPDPWAAPEGTAAAAAAKVDNARITVAVPDGVKVGAWVRIGGRVHAIDEVGAGYIEVVPVIPHPVGVSVQWGRWTICAVMVGDPQIQQYRSDVDRWETASLAWREVVAVA